MNDGSELVAGMVLGAFIVFIVCVCVGFTRTEHWHNEAVKSGHAEYYLDENSNKQWRWK